MLSASLHICDLNIAHDAFLANFRLREQLPDEVSRGDIKGAVAT
jgi:hypothetical protein